MDGRLEQNVGLIIDSPPKNCIQHIVYSLLLVLPHFGHGHEVVSDYREAESSEHGGVVAMTYFFLPDDDDGDDDDDGGGVAADRSRHVVAFRCDDAHSQQQQVINEKAVQVGVS